MEEHSENRMHYLVALLLGIAGLLIILIFVTIRSQADEENTGNASTTIENAAPTLTLTYIDDDAGSTTPASITLTEPADKDSDGTHTIYFGGVITDNNGCDDIDDTSISGRLYRSGAGADCTQDERNCYVVNNATCNVSATCSEDVSAAYECAATVYHFADATDAGSSPDYSAQYWSAQAYISDQSGSNGTSTEDSETTTINTLLALLLENADGDYDGTYRYGTTTAGGTVTTTFVIRNTGNNEDQDLRVSSSNWTCSVFGSIPVGSYKYSVTSSVYANMIAFSTNLATVGNFDGDKQDDTGAGNFEEKNLYTGVDVGNNCSGVATTTVTINAYAAS